MRAVCQVSPALGEKRSGENKFGDEPGFRGSGSLEGGTEGCLGVVGVADERDAETRGGRGHSATQKKSGWSKGRRDQGSQ